MKELGAHTTDATLAYGMGMVIRIPLRRARLVNPYVVEGNLYECVDFRQSREHVQRAHRFGSRVMAQF